MAASRDVHALGAQAARLAARGDRSTPRLSASAPLPAILLAYLVAGCAAALLALALGRSPFVCDGYLGVRGAASVLLSLGLGILIWAATAFATRAMVRRFAWARALYRGLRPAVRDAGDATLVVVAVASAFGEGLLFRGLLVPAVSVVASSVVFGAPAPDPGAGALGVDGLGHRHGPPLRDGVRRHGQPRGAAHRAPGDQPLQPPLPARRVRRRRGGRRQTGRSRGAAAASVRPSRRW